MTVTVAAIIYLSVSVLNAASQTVSLIYLRRRAPIQRRVHRALVRTATWRVVAAYLYVGVGIVTFAVPPVLAVLALSVFSFTQIVWQVNAFADMALRRHLAETESPTTRPDTGRPSTPDKGHNS